MVSKKQRLERWQRPFLLLFCFLFAQKNFISGPKSRRMLNLELSLFAAGLDFPVTASRVEVMSAQPQAVTDRSSGSSGASNMTGADRLS